VLARRGAAHGLRRHATTGQDQSGVPDGWERLDATYGAGDAFVDEVLGFGADVVLEEPEELRAEVVRRLRATAGAGAGSEVPA
jgi:predicted DNA-binding transcriptional regulator YafY